MRRTLLPLGAALCTLAAFAAAPGRAGDPVPCGPGCQIVTETTYREVTRKVCRWVPDVKKTTKWVYDCKCEEYCAPRLFPSHLGDHNACNGCDSCAACGNVRTKHFLVKKQVVEECPSMKCVVECVTEKIPCVVQRRVPSGPMPCSGGITPLSALPPRAGSVTPVSYTTPTQPLRVGGLAR